MKVVIWEGGLHLQEVEAIEAMENAFDSLPAGNQISAPGSGSSLKSQLGQAFNKPTGNMFPWKGYAGFRFVDSKGYEGEFDLLLITHDRVLIVELKDLKGKRITYSDDKWYCDGYEKYRSPVSVTQNKVYLIKNKLDKIKHKFKEKRTPWIEFVVVLSNNNDYSDLPDHQKKHVMTLNEFLKLADESQYNNRFSNRGSKKNLNTQFHVFDDLISGNNVKPKHLSVLNYITTVDDQIFPLPGQNSVYTEYVATSEANKDDKALLRQWDFSKIGDTESKTPAGRYGIIAHERDVLVEIKNQAPDLYRYCLQPKTNPTSEEITRQFHELYDLPADHKRFNEYINLYVDDFDENERITLVQVLLNQFSELHQANIAHRDIGDHSLWLSPSKKVSLSSFISSYYQPLGTVGPRREKLSVGVIPIPESTEGTITGTPFQQDVYALGIVAQLILSGQRVTVNNIERALEEINSSDAWYGDVLRTAVSKDPSVRFSDAGEFRTSLAEKKPAPERYVLHREEQLDIYRKELNPYKVYPAEEDLIDRPDKEVYISGDVIVRLWTDVNPTVDQPQIFQTCLDFLAKASQLSNLNSSYISHIVDFGIAQKTSQLFLIQENVEGETLKEWLQSDHAIESKKHVIGQLIRTIEYLHNIEIFHGDIHPGNIILVDDGEELSVTLIDYLDFSKTGEKVRNHRYSPTNIDSASECECDNFAVIRITAEILGIDWNKIEDSSDQFKALIPAIKSELRGPGGFLSLERFKQAYEDEFSDPVNQNLINIVLRSDWDSPATSIFPDNDELYIHVEAANTVGEIKVHIAGIGGSVNFFYSLQLKKIKGSTPFREGDSIGPWERNNSQIVTNAALRITFDQYSDYKALDDFLDTLDGFDDIAQSMLKESSQETNADSGYDIEQSNSIELDESSNHDLELGVHQGRLEATTSLSTSGVDNLSERSKRRPKVHEIWKSMIETEVDALPTVTLTAKPDYDPRSKLFKLQYASNGNFMDRFSVGDEVELLKKVDDKEFVCGKLDIKESNAKFLYLKSIPQKASFSIDEVFYLRTSKERSSYIRRKKAVNRILERTSVISDLVDYFGECSAHEVIEYTRGPSDDDFSVYDRDDGNGSVISLNEQQRVAFKNLIQKGPLSLLQGPPGTGKTEFIAAFTHYLINSESARHILLVSQSHQAVNTAAERIRQLCSMQGAELDVVRFSNKSTNISSGLVDAYSVYLIESQLEAFRAQLSERVSALKDSLGLPKEYINAVIDNELSVTKRLKVLKQINMDITDLHYDDSERGRLISTAESIRSQVIDLCSTKYGLVIGSHEPDEILSLISDKLTSMYGIAPNESKRMKLLISIIYDYQERLDTSPGSYEEFLARSRTLVCGTCVGMGLGHLSVRENQYDWVIIDEAARSVSSELAIAMQSGKRVLLVGDHKQLPPTYQEEHKAELSRRLKINKDDPDFEWVLKSDFERAFESEYGKIAGAKLLIQYRMAEPIGNMVSDIFYQSELKNGKRTIPDIYNNLCEALSTPVTWLDISPLGDCARSHKDKNHSSFNTEEADQIIHLLKQVEENSRFIDDLDAVAGEEPAIGVICMYGAQKRLLFRKFNEQPWSDTFRRLVKIDTVDSYQGKENRIVIVSTTLNTHDRKPRFLRVLNRINVAMSRAMDRLVIVGATDMWKDKNIDYPLGKIARYMQKNQGNDYRFIKASRIQPKKREKYAK